MFEDVTSFDDDRESLTLFLTQVKRLIYDIAFERYFDRFDYAGEPIRFEQGDLELFQGAASEYMDSAGFERLIDLVRDMAQPVLIMHGLSGRQLFAKRVMVKRNEARFVARPSGRLFRRLLQAVDVLLDSILSAVPAGTALSELKDMAGLLPKTE